MAAGIVQTRDGAVRGTLTDGVMVWRGIPYAAAPLGELRFRPPRPAVRWEGVREATVFGLICPQLPDPMDALFGVEAPPSGEDCLTLNVWSPGADDARRPVMVWIHGGAFENGSSAALWYDGTRFARDGDVVVVSLNYRLGPLGFLCLDALGGAEYAGSGNVGLLDQIAALRWVRENITAFGGDPGNVTVFGESAGAMSIGALLGTPGARGLFHKAILQSGATKHVHTLANATGAAVAIMELLGLRRGEVATLHTLPVERLIEAARAVEEEGRYNLPLLFQPVVDGVIVPDWPITGPAPSAGDRPTIPVLIGTTRDESRLFTVRDPLLSALDEEGLLAKVIAVAGAERGPALLRAYRETRPGETPLHIWDAISTDADFRIPALRVAERLAASGSPVWMYRFDYTMATLGGVFGACHGLDVPFVWNTLDKPAAALLVGDDPDAPALARRIQAAWVALARTGDPNTHALPAWPEYTLDERATMLLDLNCSLARDPASDERRLWEGAV